MQTTIENEPSQIVIEVSTKKATMEQLPAQATMNDTPGQAEAAIETATVTAATATMAGQGHDAQGRFMKKTNKQPTEKTAEQKQKDNISSTVSKIKKAIRKKMNMIQKLE